MGAYFLYGCTRLRLDLSPLAHLTSVGDSFLRDCGRLTTFDLSPLAHLTRLGDFFLRGCRGLTALDLAPLTRLTSVGDSFLQEPEKRRLMHLDIANRSARR